MKLDKLIKIYKKNSNRTNTIATVKTITPKQQNDFWLDFDRHSSIIVLRKEVTNECNQTA
jgi:hypothetical protein